MLTDISIRIYSAITGLLRREEGQDLVEYAVLVGFIGIAAGLALLAFMPGPLGTFKTEIANCITFSADCGVTP